jgi:hypothetical protein
MKTNLLLAGAALALLAGLAVVATRPGEMHAQDRSQGLSSTAPAGGPASTGQASAAEDINKDIQVTPAQGRWLVCVASYAGPEAPQMARDLVIVLRGPKFKLPAYVFNYGAEERRKELERKKAQIEQQRQWLEKMGGPIGSKIVVRGRHIDEQCAVLIAGFPDMDSARRALDQIRARKVVAGDFAGVKLDSVVLVNPQETQGQQIPVNPFRTAFVVHNPTLPAEKGPERKLDMDVLRRFNAGESYSLLKCTRPLTLVVAQYWLPAPLEQRGKGNSFLAALGMGKANDNGDPAAIPAHNLAEWLHKGNIDAYVLHTKNASIVTVGGFDSLQDPRLKTMQDRWATLSNNLSKNRDYRVLSLFPQAVPMYVPH